MKCALLLNIEVITFHCNKIGAGLPQDPFCSIQWVKGLACETSVGPDIPAKLDNVDSLCTCP